VKQPVSKMTRGRLLESLPNELMLKVMRSLSSRRDLDALTRTCKSMHNLFNGNDYTKRELLASVALNEFGPAVSDVVFLAWLHRLYSRRFKRISKIDALSAAKQWLDGPTRTGKSNWFDDVHSVSQEALQCITYASLSNELAPQPSDLSRKFAEYHHVLQWLTNLWAEVVFQDMPKRTGTPASDEDAGTWPIRVTE
jgi:hypothetical protein